MFCGTYREFQRKYKHWPKLMADLVGRHVYMKREITTRGGDTFGVGTIMEVSSVSRGMLHLYEVGDVRPVNLKRGIRQVWKTDVGLLPEKGKT